MTKIFFIHNIKISTTLVLVCFADDGPRNELHEEHTKIVASELFRKQEAVNKGHLVSLHEAQTKDCLPSR